MRFSNLAQWARQEVYPRLTLLHLGAILLLTASSVANVKYGLSLGDDVLGKMIGGTAALGAECAVGIGVASLAFALATRRWGQAIALVFVLAAGFAYNLHSGLGFQGWRDEENGKKLAVERTDKTRLKEIERIDARLKELGQTRPAGELSSEMAAILSDKRSGGCETMNGPYTRSNCPRYFELKAEHGRAVERGKLEADRRGLLNGVMAAESLAKSNPTEASLIAYLAALGIVVSDGDLMPWVKLLTVILMVFGGPLMLWVAEDRLNKSPSPSAQVKQTEQTEQTPTDAQQTEKRVEDPDLSTNVIPFRKVETSESSVGDAVNNLGGNQGKVSPSGQRLLEALRTKGGTAKGKSQSAVASEVGMARTTYCREAERLSDLGYVHLSEDGGQLIIRLVV